MKNILLVHNFYQIGGGEHTVFKNEKDILIKNGFNIVEYTKDNSSLKRNKLKLLTVPFSTIFSCKTYFDVKRIIRENKIDIVHCHNTFPLISPSVYYSAWHSKVPVVQTIHNFRFLCANGLLYRNGHICEECLNGRNNALKNKCYRNSKSQTAVVLLMQKLHQKLGTYKRLNYIFLTEFNKNKMMPLIKTKGKVFIKPNMIQKQKLIENLHVDKSKFIFIGRLDEYKGIEFLLEFFENHKEYKLHIFGDGQLKDRVLEISEKCHNIIYCGFRIKEEIQEDWQSSCAMIFPSKLYEGLPIVIVESFANGTPVLASNIGNGADLTRNSEAGILFDPCQPESLASAIKELLLNREKYSLNAIKEAEKYDEEKNLENLLEIYRELK